MHTYTPHTDQIWRYIQLLLLLQLLLWSLWHFLYSKKIYYYYNEQHPTNTNQKKEASFQIQQAPPLALGVIVSWAWLWTEHCSEALVPGISHTHTCGSCKLIPSQWYEGDGDVGVATFLLTFRLDWWVTRSRAASTRSLAWESVSLPADESI